ncbi:MAG: PrsW family intramembrane metalloprotease [Nocardioides sp.]|uniref:PrsW family intramembrane metalloprotease n=1 Tax=Nocardioides sp. TaxID=35761 RepID=UPI003EFD991D
MQGRRRDSAVFTVIVAVLVLLGAVVMAIVFALTGAPTSLAIGVLLAAVPVGPLIGCYMWLDRYEPEPRSLLVAGLLWGAFASTAAALVLGTVGAFIGVSDTASTVWGAPLTEEAGKGLFLLMLLWWRRHELDGILDGIVYAGMVGIGFAFTENILYLAASHMGAEDLGLTGAQALTGTFVVRILASPFAHPLFTAFTGIGIGLAITRRNRLVQWGAPIAGYVLAVLSHAAWNGAAVRDFGTFVLTYVLVMFPVFVTIVAFAVYRRTRERRLLAEALADAATRGLIPASDIPWLVDLAARRRARAWARQSGGDNHVKAMREYQRVAVELGFLHHRYLRGTAPEDYAVRGQEHLGALQLIRPYISFPGQVVPTR